MRRLYRCLKQIYFFTLCVHTVSRQVEGLWLLISLNEGLDGPVDWTNVALLTNAPQLPPNPLLARTSPRAIKHLLKSYLETSVLIKMIYIQRSRVRCPSFLGLILMTTCENTKAERPLQIFLWIMRCWNFKTISIGARNRVGVGLSYRFARLHRLAEQIPWNRVLGSLKVYRFVFRNLIKNERFSNLVSRLENIRTRKSQYTTPGSRQHRLPAINSTGSIDSPPITIVFEGKVDSAYKRYDECRPRVTCTATLNLA